MAIFKQLNKKGYKHYYEGTVEELDSMDKDNQHLHSEIMQVIMWLYEKHGIWVSVTFKRHSQNKHFSYNIRQANGIETYLWEHNSPTEAYEAAILYCLTKLI